MAELSKNQMDYIQKIGEAELERNNGNIDVAVKRLNALWEGIPEPQYGYKESYLVAWSMIETSMPLR